MSLNIDTKYMSTSVNHFKDCLEWNKELNLISYAAKNRIIIYDPMLSKVVAISNKHHCELPITCIRWVPQEEKGSLHLLMSVSAYSVRLWSIQSSELHGSNIKKIIQPFGEAFKVPVNHESPSEYHHLNTGSAIIFTAPQCEVKRKILIVASGNSSKIFGWMLNYDTGELESSFEVKIKDNLVFDTHLIPVSRLSNKCQFPLIAYTDSYGKIHLLSSTDGISYHNICSLPVHRFWVTTMGYVYEDNNDLLIFSGSDEGDITLWRLSLNKTSPVIVDGCEELQLKQLEFLLPLYENSSDETKSLKIYASIECRIPFSYGTVPKLDWSPSSNDFENPQLLSCAKTDGKAIIVWEPNKSEAEGVWVEKFRIEVWGGREGSCCVSFGPTRNQIAATTIEGGLFLWNYVDDSWRPQAVVSGHFDKVVDLDWDIDGRYLLTASSDQTTRVHAPFRTDDVITRWQEIARPQVHGFDLSCVACLDKHQYVSGSEEFILRVFKATSTFVETLNAVSNLNMELIEETNNMVKFATVPPLGLSNKAQENNDTEELSQSTVVEPPNEDELLDRTKWTEDEKLYGHANHIVSVAVNHGCTLIASSCKAQNKLDAKIILWDAKKWIESQSLTHHQLSVTQLMFSSCDKYLLSVSRDRTWTVFENKENVFSLLCSSKELGNKVNHTRIIWCCCWIPDTLSFITGSRDKSIFVWSPVTKEGGREIIGWEKIAEHKEPQEITAVASIRLSDELVLIALGGSEGSLNILHFNTLTNEVLKSQSVEATHVEKIRRLKFSPKCENGIRLASCGDDNATFIYELTIDSEGDS